MSSTELLDLSLGQISGRAPAGLESVIGPALEPPHNGYTSPGGHSGVRAAVAAALQLDDGPDSVVMTTGASGAFLAFLLDSLATRSAPRILLPDPCYPAFLGTSRRLGLGIDTYPVEGSHLDLARFVDGLTPQTVGAVVISPGNPTGRTVCADDLAVAEAQAAQRGIPLVLDESYADLIESSIDLEGNGAGPPALGRLHEASVRLRSFSKSFALSGFRAGAALVTPSRAGALANAHFAALMSAPTVGQVMAGACMAPQVRRPFLDATIGRLRERHRSMAEAVADVPGAWVEPAEVGVFAWMRVPGDARDWSGALAARGILVTPGVAFGPSGSHHLRVLADVPEAARARFVSACQEIGGCR